MTQNFNNGMSNKVAAANIENNNQNNNNNYKFYRISGGHDFADLAGAVEEMKDVNNAIGVRGHEGIRIFVRRDEGMWTLTMFNLVAMGKASHEEKYNLGQRMTANMVKRIENLVLAFIDTIANYEQEEQDFADFLDMCDRKDEIVSAYQTEIDGYVQDIISIAEKKEDIEKKVDAFAIKEIVKKIEQTETECYDAIMDAECDCFGTEIDLAALWNWYNNYGQHYTDNNFSRENLDLEDLISTLDYMITESDKALGLDEEDLEYINEGGCYCFVDYPMYLWQDLREFSATYYHYAYCA